MKSILLSLLLCWASTSFAQSTYTYQLNELINKAVAAKDFEKARSLVVTQQQRDYVEQAIAADKQAKAEAKAEALANRPRVQSCAVFGPTAVCR